MMVFLLIVLVLFAFWLFRGRGWWVVYRHREQWIELPVGTTREDLMSVLKKDLTYRYLKEIYYDENGNVAIVGKYNTYPLLLKENRLFVSGAVTSDLNFEPPKGLVGALSKIGHNSNRFSKENARIVEEIECIHAYILKIFDHDAPIDTHKKVKAMTRAANYAKIAYATIALAIALLFVIVFKNNFGNKNKISNAYLTEYSSTVTIGEAFEDFFSDPKWKSYEEGIQEYVDFQGGCVWGEKSVTVVITFLINDDSFVIDSIQVDGEELPIILHYSLLEAVYQEQ